MKHCHACGETFTDECAQKPHAEFREYLDKACAGSASRYAVLIKRLQDWRNADHEDHLVLCRSDVIEIIEGVTRHDRPTREQIARIIDPDAFREGYWGRPERKTDALERADKILASAITVKDEGAAS